VRRIVQRDLEPSGTPTVSIDEDSVILVLGGARGITSRIAVALADRYHCTLHLVGRTPLAPDPVEAQVRDVTDLASLRRALIGLGAGEIRSIDAKARAILAQREVVQTLAAIEAAGGKVAYSEIDARDGEALGALIDDIRQRHGRLDGVIHAAGVIEDRLAGDKTPESFQRVYATKLDPAWVLAQHLPDDVSFVALFSSVAAVFGGRGQSDYAAANDVLDKLALAMNRRASGRWFAINWGPWGGGGMISPELREQYQRRGVTLIDPTAGVQAFLDELRDGAPEDAQVILMSGEPEAVSVSMKASR
jgi:NAD(P)-dependent dehydrogenase (short-subunit alcohol dehydrogenase family)